MTIRELINALGAFSQDIEVVLSSDGEGNSFSPLKVVSEGLYVAENRGLGNFYSINELEEVRSGAKPVVALWPMS